MIRHSFLTAGRRRKNKCRIQFHQELPPRSSESGLFLHVINLHFWTYLWGVTGSKMYICHHCLFPLFWSIILVQKRFSSSTNLLFPNRAPARCLGGHGLNFCQGVRFFVVPCSCHVDHFTFHIQVFLYRQTATYI